jgi:hypothetical protein
MTNIGSLVDSIEVVNPEDLGLKGRQNFVKKLLKKNFNRNFVHYSEAGNFFTIFSSGYIPFLLGRGHTVAYFSVGKREISLRDSNYSSDTFRFSEEYRRLTGETLRVAKNT